MTDKYFYVTTPIYYVNGEPHMGSAYCSLACDIMARFKRLDGYQVKFLTGTDEHGLKIFQAARDRGIEPQAFCDEISQKFRDLIPVMNLSVDDFIRTTEARHKRAAQALWAKLADRGDIYLSKYSGWYAVSDEAYYTDEEIITNDKGEKIAIASGKPVEWMEEESYFFRLSAFQDRLAEYFSAHPEAIGPKSRFNEIMSFIKSGLQDFSISRTTFSWGVPVPGDEKHVMYVWFDALTNYLSALGYPDTTPEMQNFWPETLHIVGKDIQRFHCVYWPAMLMAADLPVPKRVYSHGWLMAADGRKMSKSFGNFLVPEDFIDTYGLDQTRFYLLRDLSFGQDGNIGHDGIQRRKNELANDFGNLAQRVLMFIFKNNEARLPKITNLTADDQALLEASGIVLLETCRKHIDLQEFHLMLEAIWMVIRQANAYVDTQAPWGLKKTDTVRMETVLGVLCETVRRVAILCQPYMPDSCGRMLDQLMVAADKRNLADVSNEIGLEQGAVIEQPQGVFPRHVAVEAPA
ncbi:MAG: methionine--tRNA ligase [Alphaproteobacteria bacterium]|nr:methionine--tRNA ligase [Alphaproteobacteria bacterium]